MTQVKDKKLGKKYIEITKVREIEKEERQKEERQVLRRDELKR